LLNKRLKAVAQKKLRFKREVLLREALPKQQVAWVIDRKAGAAKQEFAALEM
jgi:uncharacterized protein YecT (DUF1311 family)